MKKTQNNTEQSSEDVPCFAKTKEKINVLLFLFCSGNMEDFRICNLIRSFYREKCVKKD